MLKWLALLFMTIDHVGYYFSPYLHEPAYIALRIIGRLAFPVFAFYIVKGFSRTSNIFNYLTRMATWAVIAHFAINSISVYTGRLKSVFDTSWTNVLVLFTFGIIMLMGYDLALRSYHDMIASMTLVSDSPVQIKDPRFDVKVNLGGITMSPRVGIPLGILMMLISFWSVIMLHADYEIYGLLTILLMYISYNSEKEKVFLPQLAVSLFILNGGYIVTAYLAGAETKYAIIQTFSMAVIPFLNTLTKSKKKPSLMLKYLFYFYYPAHMALFIFLVSKWHYIAEYFVRIT